MQQHFPAKASIFQIADPVGFAKSLASLTWSHDMLHSFVDRGLFVAFLFSLYWILRIDSGYYMYSIFAGLIPALSNLLVSYTRYLSMVFPFFIVLAQFTSRKWLYWIVSCLSGGGQVYFLLRHISGAWIG